MPGVTPRLLLALGLVACSSPKGTAPVATGPTDASTSDASSDAALPTGAPATTVETPALDDAERAARCTAYQAVFMAAGEWPPPGFRDQASARNEGYPVLAGSRPIPKADQERLYAAIQIRDSQPPSRAPAAKGPTYIAASADAPAAALEAVVAAAPRKAELRVLVAKTPEEVIAHHATVFPHTPPRVTTRLATDPTLDTAAWDLIALAGGCAAVLEVYRPVEQGATIEVVGPGTARALERCRCRLADLDGYASLFGYILLPFPKVGYVVLDRAALAAAAPGATVADVLGATP